MAILKRCSGGSGFPTDGSARQRLWILGGRSIGIELAAREVHCRRRGCALSPRSAGETTSICFGAASWHTCGTTPMDGT